MSKPLLDDTAERDDCKMTNLGNATVTCDEDLSSEAKDLMVFTTDKRNAIKNFVLTPQRANCRQPHGVMSQLIRDGNSSYSTDRIN